METTKLKDKSYTAPDLTVIACEDADVITTSSQDDGAPTGPWVEI